MPTRQQVLVVAIVLLLAAVAGIQRRDLDHTAAERDEAVRSETAALAQLATRDDELEAAQRADADRDEACAALGAAIEDYARWVADHIVWSEDMFQWALYPDTPGKELTDRADVLEQRQIAAQNAIIETREACITP